MDDNRQVKKICRNEIKTFNLSLQDLWYLKFWQIKSEEDLVVYIDKFILPTAQLMCFSDSTLKSDFKNKFSEQQMFQMWNGGKFKMKKNILYWHDGWRRFYFCDLNPFITDHSSPTPVPCFVSPTALNLHARSTWSWGCL